MTSPFVSLVIPKQTIPNVYIHIICDRALKLTQQIPWYQATGYLTGEKPYIQLDQVPGVLGLGLAPVTEVPRLQ